MTAYNEDLAYIHDLGYRDYALNSAPGILAILAQHHIHQGLIVDLGCGSGLSAQEFTNAGYSVLGIDISEALIAIARTKVSNAEFKVASLFKTDLPGCHAVTSIGECFNYRFDVDQDSTHLVKLFQRVFKALAPGGLFIFDIAEPNQVKSQHPQQSFNQARDWVVLVEKQEDHTTAQLTRRITTFRKMGDVYRRSDEVHRLQLYSADAIATQLQQIGFRVETQRQYGAFELPENHTAFIASKPEQ